MDVRGHDGRRRDRAQLTAGELFGAGRVGLLARLKDGQQRGRQRGAERVGGAGQRHQRRHVDVVPARVHGVAGGAEGGAGTLADRQAVELCPHRDRRLGVRTHAGEATRAGRSGGRHRELLGHRPGGLLLGVAQLRAGVQAMAQLDRSRQLPLERAEQAREQIVSRSRHSGGTPRRARVAPRHAAPRA